MMQVYIKRSDLASAGNKAIPVLATFDDGVTVDPNWRSDAVVLTVPASAFDNTAEPPGALRAGWQDSSNAQQIMSSEASKRIEAVFPDYAQRNSIAEIEANILQYGVDSTKWPETAKQRKTEFDRCWNYIKAVRTAAGRAMPNDPTADSNWPTRISSYKP